MSLEELEERDICQYILIIKLKKHFIPVRVKASLRRQLYGKSMSFYDKPSVFFLRKLDLIKMSDVQLSYAAFMDIIASLFTIILQNFLDMK